LERIKNIRTVELPLGECTVKKKRLESSLQPFLDLTIGRVYQPLPRYGVFLTIGRVYQPLPRYALFLTIGRVYQPLPRYALKD
jgi:hypothetical protein